MDRKIQDYLHLYIGAEIQIEYGYPEDKKIGLLTGFRAGAGWEIWPHKESWVRVPKGERVVPAIVRDELVKPILRPLSDMTEEEYSYIGIELKAGIWNAEDIKAWANTDLLWTVKNLTPKVFAYLLSRGFDLFNLIPDKLAIDKTTLSL